VGVVVLFDTWHQFFRQPDQLWLNGHINLGLTELIETKPSTRASHGS